MRVDPTGILRKEGIEEKIALLVMGGREKSQCFLNAVQKGHQEFRVMVSRSGVKGIDVGKL